MLGECAPRAILGSHAALSGRTTINTFIAIVFVCANAIPVESCGDDKASEVRKVKVANELGCTGGWQEIIARTDLGEEVGKTAYLKTECRRVKQPG